MKAYSVVFNIHKDDVKVNFTKEFLECDWVIQADILKDSLYILEKHYHAMLSIENANSPDEVTNV